MAFGQQDDSGVPLPVIPLVSGATDNPNAPQSPVPDITKKVKPFGTTPQKVDYDPNFPLLSKSKGFKEAMAKSENEPGPDESTLPKSVLMQRHLNTMENSPIYKQANAELRLKLQMAFYKQYVEPTARLDGQNVTLKDWLKARGDEWLKTHPNPKISTSDISKFSLAATDELVKTAAGITDLTSEAVEKLKWDNIKKQWFNLKGQIGAASAMLDGQLSPHMGPILVDIPHQELEKVHYNPNIPGMGMNMDELYNSSDYAQHHFYRNSAYDQLLLKGGGRMTGIGLQLHLAGMAGEAAGGLRAVDSAKLLESSGQTAEEISAARKLYSGSKLFGRFGVYAGDVASSSIHEAAKGAVVGTVQRGGHPAQEAVSWGLGTAALTPAGTLLGKLRIWGDQKVTSEMLDKAVEEYLSKHPSSTSTPVAVAMAGSPAQKLTRGLMEALNKETNGGFWNAPLAAKQSTLKALATKYPELAANAGWLDEHLTELQALHETAQWRELMPEADQALKKLEAIDGTPTSKTIAQRVSQQEQADFLKTAPPGTVAKATGNTTGVPGAASSSSLEFSDNFTKHVDSKLNALGLGKDKYTWETRGHKLLFYLNVLASETKLHGPSTERSQEAQLLMHQLMQEFPGKNLKELLAMSDTLWTKISNLEKGGFVKAGTPTRIFRQTHLEPGESPFAHEVDLLQKVAKAEKAKRIEAAKAAKLAKSDARQAQAIQLQNLHAKLATAEGEERFRIVREIRDVQAKIAGEKPIEAQDVTKTARKAKAEAPPTEKPADTSKEMQTAMGQYVSALRKLGYNNDDISKMTPQQLVEIISKKTPKISPKVAAVSGEVVGKEVKGARLPGESPEDWARRTAHLFDTTPKKHAIFGNKTFSEFVLNRPLNEVMQDLKAKGFVPDKAKLDRYTKGETATLSFTHPDGHSLTIGINKDGIINGGTFGAGGKDVPVIEATPAQKKLTDDEKLAAAFKKSGDAGTGKIDTGILNQVMERMFPGMKYADLTTAEQSEVNQVAAKLSKSKGGK